MPTHPGYLEGYQKICSQAIRAFCWASFAITKHPGTEMEQRKDAILFGMKLCFWCCKNYWWTIVKPEKQQNTFRIVYILHVIIQIDPLPVHRLKFKVRFRRVTRRNPLPKMNNDWKRGHPTIYIHTYTCILFYIDMSYFYVHLNIYNIYLHIHMWAYASKLFRYIHSKRIDDFIPSICPTSDKIFCFWISLLRWVSTSKRSHQWILRFLTSREGVVLNRASLL